MSVLAFRPTKEHLILGKTTDVLLLLCSYPNTLFPMYIREMCSVICCHWGSCEWKLTISL